MERFSLKKKKEWRDRENLMDLNSLGERDGKREGH
jgi:hypothetical protein